MPLWNLEGKLWLRPTADGVELELAEGDLSPGLFQLRARPEVTARSLDEAQANVREANWAARRLVARSPLAEPAMTAAAAAGAAAGAVAGSGGPRSGVDPRRKPTAPLAPPALDTLDGTPLGRAARDHCRRERGGGGTQPADRPARARRGGDCHQADADGLRPAWPSRAAGGRCPAGT